MEKTDHSIKPFTVTIPANSQVNIVVNGDFVHYTTGNGDIEIETDSGSKVRRSVGGSCKVYSFTRIKITNLTTVNDTKVFHIGYGDLTDNAVSGEVDVDSILSPVATYSDITKQLTDKNKFIGGYRTVSSTSNYSCIALHNPTGSGKILIVESIKGGANINGAFTLHMSNTALSTVKNGINKDINGAVSVGELQWEFRSVIPGTFIADYFTLQSENRNILNGSPFVIREGFNVLTSPYTVNAANASIFEWYEIDS